MNPKSFFAKTAILFSLLLISFSAYSLDADEEAEPAKEPSEKAEASDTAQERSFSQQVASKPPQVMEHEKHGDLGAAATDPTAALLSFRLQNQYTSSYRNAEGYGNAALFQAVIPAKMPFKTVPSLIQRFTLPYVTTPNVNGSGHKTGMGDSGLLQLFVTDWLGKGQVFAFGPAWTIPTAGDNEATGSGQWQVGANFVYMNSKTPQLQWGVLMFNQRDFAKTRDNAKDVSTLNIQPIFTKHFDKGWYVAPPDVPQTYNFKTNTWTLALGGVVGRVFPVAGKPTQIYGGIYYNPVSENDIVSSKWTFKFNWSFLIPMK